MGALMKIRTENDQYKWLYNCSSSLLQTLIIDTCDPLIGCKHKEYGAERLKENLQTLSEAKHYCNKRLFQSNLEETTENDETQDEDIVPHGPTYSVSSDEGIPLKSMC